MLCCGLTGNLLTSPIKTMKNLAPRHLLSLCSISLLVAVNVTAEEPEYVEVPPPPERVESDDVVDDELEPEVTIIQREDATVEEYRVNGRLYMVKITPVAGKPYYLLDRDGDGMMDRKMTDLYDEPRVPQWVLFSW